MESKRFEAGDLVKIVYSSEDHDVVYILEESHNEGYYKVYVIFTKDPPEFRSEKIMYNYWLGKTETPKITLLNRTKEKQ
tara:strand:- start:11401 stop:11637 length:237 start_codon:yes stop_codon:yes gene_type:complete